MIVALHSLSEISALLESCGLNLNGVDENSPPKFFGIYSGERLVACIGIEVFEHQALLRSLAVDAAYRGHGFANQLVAYLESFAFNHHVVDMYLFSSSAVPFFERQGYSLIRRDEAPEAIKQTAQFREQCCREACLHKRLELIA